MSDATNTLTGEISKAILNTAPPVVVWVFGLNQLFVTLSIVYVLLQGAYLIWRWRTQALTRAEDKAAIKALMKRPVAQPGDRAP